MHEQVSVSLPGDAFGSTFTSLFFQSQSEKGLAVSGESNLSDLDQIKQILVGSYLHEIDNRFKSLGEELSTSMEELRKTLVERSDSISSSLEQNIQSLREEIGQERDRSTQAEQDLQQAVSSTRNDLQQQLGALGQTLAATESSIRQDTTRTINDLKDNIREQLGEIRERLDSEFSRIDGATVTRRSFRDALLQLSSQFDEQQN